MIKNNAIGVYDSGIGGLTVFKELVKILPNEKYIYFGDLKNLPYGEKTKDELSKIAGKIFDFFEKQNVKAVVMACNTTSALLYDEIKNKYPYNVYPVIQTVAKDLAELNINRLGVFATEATINSHAYKNNIKKYNSNIEIFEQACPNWVKIVENKDFSEKNIEIIKSDLDKMLKNKPEKIILGCTHYPYLTDILSRYVNKNMFINPAEKFAGLIAQNLKECGIVSDGNNFSETFYVSKNTQNFIKSAQLFYNVKTTPILKNL